MVTTSVGTSCLTSVVHPAIAHAPRVQARKAALPAQARGPACRRRTCQDKAVSLVVRRMPSPERPARPVASALATGRAGRSGEGIRRTTRLTALSWHVRRRQAGPRA